MLQRIKSHNQRYGRLYLHIAACLGLVLLPQLLSAQSIPEQVRGLHGVLDNLFATMMPKCGQLSNYARAIGGFAATFYIGNRVWKHIANNEAIDFYPLFRPFCLAFCIGIFPQVIDTMEIILSPAKYGTQAIVDNTNADIQILIERREKEMQKHPQYKMYGINEGRGDRDEWLKYTHEEYVGKEDWLDAIPHDIEFAMSKAYYNMKMWFKDLISFCLQLLYEAAALCVNTVRTFNLIICAMIGPLVFALAIFDGLQHSLVIWIARYVNFYLWLPVANICGAILGTIQTEMIKLDISQVEQYGDSFFTTADVGYIIFTIIGIVTYTSIPNISSFIVNPGGGSALTSKITNSFSNFSSGLVGGVVGGAASGMGALANGAGFASDGFGDMNNRMNNGVAANQQSGYMQDKLRG
ncbi:conjugative transposon protein TraJ [Chitinophaga arvensicola]|uniref:Bacteroides conjugative transposon TraJ protein n=1 Tax=Chitinophaga arvensicola TaxID=29529 RepID=A0A1I0PNE6_9BACT|nr:conjugative transposon protein TraJ [Chitinophaga arvensicola]SEW15863.1 Bacteroides conjugative transposon TraJ protein [Chitinophaga arvensicola]